MHPLISTKYYLNSDIFQQEKSFLFQNTWTFAGLTSEVSKHNDYLQINLGNQSVVIHNFSGELKAFDNICTHRFCQIHTDIKGNRPLQCPYHGWAFDRSGVPVGIPDSGSFDCLDSQVRYNLKLKNWLLATCGSFIFIKQSDDGISLENYLGEALSQILIFSNAIGNQIFDDRITVNANWKIVVENTLEGYHVNSVHSDTFGKFSIENPKFTHQKYHSSYRSTSTDIDKKWRRIKRLFVDREIGEDFYNHQLIFPNLNFAFSQGISFFIQIIRPVSIEQTQVINYVFIANLNRVLSQVEEEIVSVFSNSIGKFYEQVFLEDKQICEQIQRGISSINAYDFKNYKGILSSHEQRIYTFHQAYIDLMKS